MDDVNEPQPPVCYRCGQPATVLQFRLDGKYSSLQCSTPGCVDEHGSRTPNAPTPQELASRSDRMLLDRQQALIRERP